MSEYGSRPHGYYYNSLHRRSASSQHGKKLFRKSYLDAEVDLISFAYCQLRFSVSLVIGLGQLYLTLMLPVVVYGKREKKIGNSGRLIDSAAALTLFRLLSDVLDHN